MGDEERTMKISALQDALILGMRVAESTTNIGEMGSNIPGLLNIWFPQHAPLEPSRRPTTPSGARRYVARYVLT